ncbi:early endosome antigen 1-like [Engraulis encrasicolus]|uniref:early endosome antigen 1-like n=1 Tax=Engraulis encrasicolus TaxID=184585 RepID=UPI002FD08886
MTEEEKTFIMTCLDFNGKDTSMEFNINELNSRIVVLSKNLSDVKRQLRQEKLQNGQQADMPFLRIREMQMRISGWIEEMDAKTISVAKLTLRVLEEYMRVQNLKSKMSFAKGAERTALKDQLKKREETLRQAELDLIGASGSSNLIMQIVKLRERIIELESREPNDDLDQEINELREQLEKLLKQIEGKPDVSGVTQIIQFQEHILHLSKRLQIFKQQAETKITELKKQLALKNSQLESQSSKGPAASQIIIIQKEIDAILGHIEYEKKKLSAQTEELERTITNNKNLMTEQLKALEKANQADYDLIVKVIAQQIEIGEIERQECSAQKDALDLLAELQEKVAAKEADIINLQENNKRLQQQLQDMTHECSAVKDQIKVLEGSLVEEIQKVKGDQKAILELLSLKLRIQQIKMNIASEKTSERIIEMKAVLKQEEEKMKDKATEIINSGLEGSAEVVNIISFLVEIWGLQTGVESEDTLIRIRDLQMEVERQINTLKDTVNSKLLLSVLASQTDQTRIKRLTVVISEKYELALAELHTKLNMTEEALNDKMLQLETKDKDRKAIERQIKTLQSEIERLDADIKALNKTASAKIADLEQQLRARERELREASKQMQEADKKNGELLIRITTLVAKLEETERNAYEKNQHLTFQITSLEKKVESLTKENNNIKENNKALEKEIEECSGLQQRYDDLKKEIDDLMSTVSDSHKFILQINDLTIEIEDIQKSIAGKPDKAVELKKQLDEKLKELEALKNKTTNVPGSKESE